MNNELFHYGTPRHSGRYPWGSGEEPYQHPYQERKSFIAQYGALKGEGMTDTEIAKYLGMTVNDFRKKRSIALAEEHADNVCRAQRLRNKGYSLETIGRMIGGEDNPIGESTIRGWLKQSDETRKDKINNVADILEEKVKRGEMLDVGIGSNLDLNVTKTTFDTALKVLEEKGYVVGTIDIEQPNAPGKYTTIKYLAPEGTTKAEAWNNRENINTITNFSPDGGKTIMNTEPPSSLSLDRVKIVYAEDGGTERDGMVGIRRNVEDLSMGNSLYSQVRIAVDNKYYIKGMAIYQDDIPDGYDIVVYSNKSKEKGVEKALKPLKDDPDNPFGATIKAGGQSYYPDEKGKYVKVGDKYVLDEKGTKKGDHYSLSPLNKIKEETDWDHYRRSLPAQFLSKQPLQLIQRQLDLTYKNKYDEYEDIMALDNPAVKKKLLMEFAEGVDKNARHLDAAALPRQDSKVIIPVPSLKNNEVYAPTYKDGEQLALVRFPHAGTFEIPVLTVNNKNAESKSLLQNAVDAIGINKNVADRLSGADFDGDTVLTIPISSKVKIKSTDPLPGLKGFDPSEAYPKYEGMKVITSKEKGKQMGIVTNLITDMSLQHATPEEMARAVRHSMVVIDAEKHELNWKLSEQTNGIEALKQKYQQNPDKKKGYGGSSTLLSRLGNAEIDVAERKKSYKPDPETGKWLYEETGSYYTKVKKDKKGNIKYDQDGNPIVEKKYRTQKVSPLDMVDDAYQLSSGTSQENAYANHINKMRSLANTARKEAVSLTYPPKDSNAAKTYEDEVNTLKAKLNIALKNKPLERQAQIQASVKIEELKKNNPELTESGKKDKLKKEKAKILTESRNSVGSGKISINITDKEWEAIQSRAISGTMLSSILNNADMDRVRKLATPKESQKLNSSRVSRISALDASGFTISEIAELVGCSTSTVSKYLKGDV